MSITELGADAAENSGSSGSNGDSEYEYERYDLNGVFFGMQHPTTAVSGEAVALRKLWDENDPDRSDVAVILENSDVVTSEEALEESVVVTSEEEGDQFKVVNLADSDTRAPSDEMIDFDGNTFYGEIQDTFPGDMEPIALKRGGGAGRRISKTLDVQGATGAGAEVERDDEGNLTGVTLDDGGFPAHNGGYIERDPRGYDEGEPPRQARDPELRPDVEGNEVVIMVQRRAEIDADYDGNAYWATVFADLTDEEPLDDSFESRQAELIAEYTEDSDLTEEDITTDLGGSTLLRLEPTDEFEPDEALLEDTGWIEWNGFDRDDPEELRVVNEARVENDFGNIYVPEGTSVEEATPEGVEVVSDPTEEDLESDTAITAFGAGAPDYDVGDE